MINNFSKYIYLRLNTSKGEITVNVISNVTSQARISNPRVEPDAPNSVSFDYTALNKKLKSTGTAKTIKRDFDFKIFEVLETIYGQKKIFVRVIIPKGEKRTIALVGNASSPALVDNVKIVGNNQIDFRYMDLKTMSEKNMSKKVDLQILSIDEFIYGDMPQCPYNQTLKTSFLDLIDLLIKTDLNYWVESGTLLGTLRSHGMIPWDNNCNLGIIMEDVPKLTTILEKTYRFYLSDVGGLHMVERAPFGRIDIYDMKINATIAQMFYYKKSPNVPAYWKNKPEGEESAFYWCHACDKSSVWKNTFKGVFNYPESYLLPFRKEFFYNRHVNIPAKSEEHCTHLYGPKYMTHKNKNNARFVLEKDYRPTAIKDLSPL